MRLRSIYLALALGPLAGNAVLADEAYTWTDEDGIVHFSDRPHPGARRLQLESSPTRAAATPRRARPSADSAGDTESAEPAAPFRYENLEIVAPAPEQTLWNIEGTLSVSLRLTPALQPGHRVQVYFDGSPRTVQGTNFQIDEVYRGVHNIQAEVQDETGKLMIRSLPNRFYVQQNTVVIRR